MAGEKTAYVSPPNGVLEISLIRGARPCVQLTVDLGIPNFTVFSLKFPLVEGETRAMTELAQEGLAALLDDITAFMLSMSFEDEICTLIYACILNCFKHLSIDSSTPPTDMPQDDEMVETYRGQFAIPMDFVNETFDKVVTASSIINRMPATRHLLLTPCPKTKAQEVNEAARVIRMFRNKTLNQQPRPLYVILYDQKGRGVGVLPAQKFKSQLLRPSQRGK